MRHLLVSVVLLALSASALAQGGSGPGGFTPVGPAGGAPVMMGPGTSGNWNFQQGFVPSAPRPGDLNLSVGNGQMGVPGMGMGMGIGTVNPGASWDALANCFGMLGAMMSNNPGAIGQTLDYNNQLYDSVDNYSNDELRRRGRSFYEPRNDRWRDIGRAINSRYPDSTIKRCQLFIDEKGGLGTWGEAVVRNMQRYNREFYDMTPGDIRRFCPKFNQSFTDKDSRDRFWVSFFSAFAKPESQCKPGVTAQGIAPGKVAVGLFQMEPAACRNRYSHQQLLDPYNNISCAVERFAKQMRDQGTLFVPCSNCGQGRAPGTYWAGLRSDIDPSRASSARRREIHASIQVMAETRKIPGCN